MPGQYEATAWGQPLTVELVCPSGQKCLVRKIGMEDIVELNIMDDVDFLGGIVSGHADKAAGKKPQDRQSKKPTKAQQAAQEEKELREMIADKARFMKMVQVMDRLVAHTVVAPEIETCWVENKDGSFDKLSYDERKNGVIYSDSVSLGDKMYIFDYCFEGVNKTKRFRDESGQAVEDLGDEPEPADTTE